MHTSDYDHRKHNNHNIITIVLSNKNNLGSNEIPDGEMGYIELLSVGHWLS